MENPDVVDQLAAIHDRLKSIEDRLHDALPPLPADAKLALIARRAAQARGFFWVKEFAAVVGRHKQWVSDRCAASVIKTLAGGRPHRIPLSEEARWNQIG